MKSTYKVQSPTEKKKCQQKQELHTMVAEAADAAIAKKSTKRRASAKRKTSSCEKELKQFKRLHVSDSGDSKESVDSALTNKS